MFIKMIFAATLAAFIAAAAPTHRASAQTAVKEESKAKAEAGEKKAAKAEKKAKKRADRTAAKARQQQCGTEWKEARAAGKVEKYMTWPKYYSECNKRLKEKAA
jgi:hypothetical protein